MMAGAGARLRAVPPDFDGPSLSSVDATLRTIASDEAVAIGLAIESGSRAWSFASPDSDYDCRFIFVRRADDYLSPWPKRDVIELPLAGDLDINGWELGKTLKLLVKGNAVAIEWLMSPIFYDGDARFRDDLRVFAAQHADRAAVMRHYLHLGTRQRRTYFADGRDVHLKKILYALRPAAALRWFRAHPDGPMPPMHFPTLIAESEAPTDVARIVSDLMDLKARTRELGTAPLPPVIESFIDDEFARAADLPARASRISADAKDAAEILFREAVARFEPQDRST